MEAIAHQHDTLDLLCWRHAGATAGVVEATLIANPGLADLGPLLPHGTRVHIPEAAIAAPTHAPLVQLWS